VYPLLTKLDSGYSIVCEGVDGQKYAAFLPLRDRFGDPLTIHEMGDSVEVSSPTMPVQNGSGDALAIPRSTWSSEVDLDNIDLKPGVIPIRSGTRYPVLTQSEGNLSIQFASAVLTQMVVVAESQTQFLTLTEIADEAAKVEQQKAKEAEQRKQEEERQRQQQAKEAEQRKQEQAKQEEQRKQEQAKEEEQQKQEEERQRQQQAKDEEQRKQEQAKVEEQRNRVQASISVVATILQITNLNSFDWTPPIILSVNSRYKYEVPRRYQLVKSGEVLTVDLTGFADSLNAQNKFDPSTTRVTSVTVSLAGHGSFVFPPTEETR